MEEDILRRKKELETLLKISEKREQLEATQKMMSEPDFWQDQKKAVEISHKASKLSEIIDLFEKADSKEEIDKLEFEALYSAENDQANAILSIHAGAGGTEAQDWAEMLQRMYLRYSERKGYSAEVVDTSLGEEAGIKSTTIRIIGLNAFGNLKSEAGVHRLVRISPFDGSKSRHTSFALVEVIPEIENAGALELDPKEIRIDVFRASGKGGQGVNTTDSAVRITHFPTKLVVTCQDERSQLQNREKAIKILKSRIFEIQEKENKAKESELKGEHVSAEWGSQIRSYVLQPYQLVKDNRTGVESTDPKSVLDGEIDQFIEGYLRKMTN
ncbi:MAG: peptide chain release factor 2 [Patescibacteria group bacterium]